MGEVSISYESLFELLRREKAREELQALDNTFYNDVAAYLKFLMENQKSGTLLGFGDRQLQNAKKLLSDLYEKREKKILGMAFDSARLPSSLVDKSAMLKEEQALYEGVLALLKKFREDVLAKVLDGKGVGENLTRSKPEESLNQQNAEQFNEEGYNDAEQQENSEVLSNKKKVRFLRAVEQFVDAELNVWGPFEQDSTAELPNDVADILLSRGDAELCEQNA